MLASKNRLVMNWYSFLGRGYSFFNAIVSCLIDIQKRHTKMGLFWGLWVFVLNLSYSKYCMNVSM